MGTRIREKAAVGCEKEACERGRGNSLPLVSRTIESTSARPMRSMHASLTYSTSCGERVV